MHKRRMLVGEDEAIVAQDVKVMITTGHEWQAAVEKLDACAHFVAIKKTVRPARADNGFAPMPGRRIWRLCQVESLFLDVCVLRLNHHAIIAIRCGAAQRFRDLY
jgi:hypothetical protein